MTGSLPVRSGSAAAISAHRGGIEDAPEGTYEAYQAAARTGAEYIEFDIRRTADDELVVYHAAAVDGDKALTDISYATLSELAGYNVLALEILGAGNFVATTLEDVSVAAIKARFPAVPVALSLGRDVGQESWRSRLSARRGELYPLSRIHACGADWAAINRRIALLGALRQCHRHGIRTMIWTVNSDTMIARWLADSRVDVLVTDRPRRAIALREQLPRRAK